MTQRVDLTKGPPSISSALVNYLEAVYPDRFPTALLRLPIEQVSGELARLAGQRDVVAYLRHHLDAQSKPAPPKSPF